MEAAERAREVAERSMLITVHRAVLCAAAAGGWEAVQPGRDVIRQITQRPESIAQSLISHWARGGG
jgi:hypothetical protein